MEILLTADDEERAGDGPKVGSRTLSSSGGAVALLYISLILSAVLNPQAPAEGLDRMTPQQTVTRDWVAAATAWGERSGYTRFQVRVDGLLGRTAVAAPLPPMLPEPKAVTVVETVVVEKEEVRPIGPDDPLRVLVIGDSLLNLTGKHLERLLESTERAAVAVEYHPSTGIVRDDYFDWPGRLRDYLEEDRPPDVIVVMIGANDSQHIQLEHEILQRWTPEWQAEYSRRVGEMMDMAADVGSRVYWVGLPVMRRSVHQNTEQTLNQVLFAAAERRHSVTFLSTRQLFAGEAGEYQRWMLDDRGRRVVARESDGVHFTDAGAQRLSQGLLASLDVDWGVLGPRRDAQGALVSVAPTVRVTRTATANIFQPLASDPSASWPALYLLSGSWGTDWSERAADLLKAQASRFGLILIAVEGEPDSESLLTIAQQLPVDQQGIAGLSTSATRAHSLAVAHPEVFGMVSWVNGVIDGVVPPWRSPPLGLSRGLTPPSTRAMQSSGTGWSDVDISPPPTNDQWHARIERHIALHAWALASRSQGLPRKSVHAPLVGAVVQ